MPIVQTGVLVCMVMDKLLVRAPRAPPALPAPAQPLHAVPGSQVPRSAGLQLHTALPFPVIAPEPAPTHELMSHPAWPQSAPVPKEVTDAQGWAAPSCPAPWLRWWEACGPVVPHAPVLRADPDQLKAMHFPKKMGKHAFVPSTSSDKWDFGRWVSGGTGWRFGAVSGHVFFQQGKPWILRSPCCLSEVKMDS